jgi:hypothetical protein
MLKVMARVEDGHARRADSDYQIGERERWIASVVFGPVKGKGSQ